MVNVDSAVMCSLLAALYWVVMARSFRLISTLPSVLRVMLPSTISILYTA